jgi:hypothetical protein
MQNYAEACDWANAMIEDEKVIELREDGEATGIEEERPDPNQEVVQIERPFDPDKIKVARETKTVSLLCTRIDHDEIDLAPEFQRRARIWDQGRKGRLIESILLRIPLPVFYVASDLRDVWSVVDGLQRMTTIHDFVNDEFPLRGLEYLVQFEKAKFSELPRNMQRRIEETELVINVIQPGTPEEVMFNIFSRINTGGITLNSQEIRHALNKGPVRSFLLDLVSTEEFKTATSDSVSDVRMSARECALRFCAFYLSDWKDYKNNDLDGFLNAAMKRINEMSEEARDELKSAFKRSMSASYKVLGDEAFRKRYRPDASKSPISKALFETWSVALSKLGDQQVSDLAENGSAIHQKFMSTLKEDRDFEVSISYATGVPGRVHKRFSTIEKLVHGEIENA